MEGGVGSGKIDEMERVGGRWGGGGFPHYICCIQHSVLNTVHIFMVLLEDRDGVGRWRWRWGVVEVGGGVLWGGGEREGERRGMRGDHPALHPLHPALCLQHDPPWCSWR